MQSVCVYCASSTQIDEKYFRAAEELGTLIAQHGLRLVTGAGRLGLMNGVIALPGGCGTMEELLEIITWKQLGLYLNPIVILNIDGFYDSLLEQLKRALDDNFMRAIHADIWKVATTPAEAVELLMTTPVWDKSIRKFAAI